MPKKTFTLDYGKITVTVQDKFEVYKKPLPDGLDPEVEWIGNFGIREAESGRNLDGEVPRYSIDVKPRRGKTLVYWDGKQIRKVPNQRATGWFFRRRIKGDLDLGDPPIGMH